MEFLNLPKLSLAQFIKNETAIFPRSSFIQIKFVKFLRNPKAFFGALPSYEISEHLNGEKIRAWNRKFLCNKGKLATSKKFVFDVGEFSVVLWMLWKLDRKLWWKSCKVWKSSSLPKVCRTIICNTNFHYSLECAIDDDDDGGRSFRKFSLVTSALRIEKVKGKFEILCAIN